MTAVVALAGCAANAPELRQQELSDASPSSGGGARYAAFGDSYSAGEGTGAYAPGTDVPGTNMCHRSTLAYPEVLSAQGDAPPVAFVACSGGTTADLFAANNNQNKASDGLVEPAQLCQADSVDGIAPCGTVRTPVIGPDTRLVTFTIGGNDIGFARVAEACVYAAAGRYRVGLPGRGCREDPDVIARTLRRIAALNGVGQDESPYGTTIHSVAEVLKTIHALAPQAQVYIAGYPRIFQPTDQAPCQVGTATAGPGSIPIQITAADARAFDDAVQTLDVAVRAAATTAGPWATYVDPTPPFAGHGLCSDDPWFNPLRSTVSYDPDGLSIAISSDPGSVHPTPTGQRDGYAAAFLRAGVHSS